MTNTAPPIYDTVFIIKWTASVIQILGYAATGFDLVPWNSYIFIVGLIGWFAVGVLWNDRAIMLIHVVAFVALIAGLLSAPPHPHCPAVG